MVQLLKRILTAPDEPVSLLTDKLSAMKRERDRVAQEVAKLKNASKPDDVDALVDAAMERLWTLADGMKSANPSSAHALFQQVVDRIDLSFSTVQQGERQIHPLKSGKVVFKVPISRGSSRGDWICEPLDVVGWKSIRQARPRPLL